MAVAESSSVQSNQQKERCNNVNYINNKIESTSKHETIPDEMMSLISKVREILCDCGEGFIQVKILYEIFILN